MFLSLFLHGFGKCMCMLEFDSVDISSLQCKISPIALSFVIMQFIYVINEYISEHLMNLVHVLVC